MPLRRCVSFSLLRDHVNNDAFRVTACFPEHLYHCLYVMSVDRSQIGYAHVLEEHPGDDQLFETALVFFQSVNNGNTAWKAV